MCNIPHCCLPQESGPCLSPNVAVHPLRPATDRRLGGPLPHQPANQTRVHLIPSRLFTPEQSFLTVIPLYRAGCPRVTHPSATQSQSSSSEESKESASFDLHVLGTPPAFILSQDQTLVIRTWIRSFRILRSFTLLDDLMSKPACESSIAGASLPLFVPVKINSR